MANSLVFSKLIEEYGNAESDDEEEGQEAMEKETKTRKTRKLSKDGEETESEEESSEEQGPKKRDEAALMQAEERNTGAVTWNIYKSYLNNAGGLYWGPWILLLLTLAQAANGNARSLFKCHPKLITFESSRQYSVPRLLDVKIDSWFPTRALHGGVCWARCAISFFGLIGLP